MIAAVLIAVDSTARISRVPGDGPAGQQAEQRPVRHSRPGAPRRARQLEAEGHRILKLSIGNTAPFGLMAPDSVVTELIQNIGEAQGVQSMPRASTRPGPAVSQYYTTLSPTLARTMSTSATASPSSS